MQQYLFIFFTCAAYLGLQVAAHPASLKLQPHRRPPSRDSRINDASSPQYYIAWFIPPSGSLVTNFVSTMTVPGLSANTNIGPRYVWPGLENDAGSFVFQDVLGDQQPPGQWTFATWYVGDGGDKEYPLHNVGNGDAATSTFNLQDQAGNTWVENFAINGPDATTGSTGQVSFSSQDTLTNALFAIELWDNSQWDFGSVTWSNISITVATTDTNWCTSPTFETAPNIGSFQYTISTPQASSNGGSVTCTIDQLVFESP